jgi:DNA-binding MarR family transcriptional regulator
MMNSTQEHRAEAEAAAETAPPVDAGEASDVVALASRLRFAVMRLSRRLRQQTPDAITPSQISALSVVEGSGPLTLGELAALERVQPPTITRTVAALEEQGLVVREVDATDRRVARVSIAPNGKRLLERSRGRKNAYLAQRLRLLSQEDVAAIHRAAELLERMAEGDR